MLPELSVAGDLSYSSRYKLFHTHAVLRQQSFSWTSIYDLPCMASKVDNYMVALPTGDFSKIFTVHAQKRLFMDFR